MKKTIILIFAVSLLLCSCGRGGANNQTANEYFEAMSDAVLQGDYNSAVELYEKGADSASSGNVTDVYFHALALKAYKENGCIGKALYYLSLCSDEYKGAESLFNELSLHAEKFDGMYKNGDFYYLYITDGKIAIGEGHQLTGDNYASGELVFYENEYYWAAHGEDGINTLMYKLFSDNGTVTVSECTENKTFSGVYTSFDGKQPMLFY